MLRSKLSADTHISRWAHQSKYGFGKGECVWHVSALGINMNSWKYSSSVQYSQQKIITKLTWSVSVASLAPSKPWLKILAPVFVCTDKMINFLKKTLYFLTFYLKWRNATIELCSDCEELESTVLVMILALSATSLVQLGHDWQLGSVGFFILAGER